MDVFSVSACLPERLLGEASGNIARKGLSGSGRAESAVASANRRLSFPVAQRRRGTLARSPCTIADRALGQGLGEKAKRFLAHYTIEGNEVREIIL